MSKSQTALVDTLIGLDPRDIEYATRFVDCLLPAAHELAASDVHLLPTASGLEIAWRIDGVLRPVGNFSPGVASNVVTRLKVLAELLTYRTDVPQEGRLRTDVVEMRLSTMPTLHGEKAVLRLFKSTNDFQRIDDLGLPAEVRDALRASLRATSGAILVTGPAGSGKTTTLYACLREIVAASGSGRSIVTLEDPIEMPIAGVTQSQTGGSAVFDMATGLRAVVRQDPEVILLGEIRDRPTAEVALQASLTGQLVLSSFHAASAVGAISRMLDMGIEPYVLCSGVLGIISQRLLRRRCGCNSENAQFEPTRCAQCGGTGYSGRVVIAEMLNTKDSALHRAILERQDADRLAAVAAGAGMIDLAARAKAAVEAGLTTVAEVERLLGHNRGLNA